MLLTHEPPHGATELHPKYADEGSHDVRELLALLRPRVHFCGHYHEPGAPLTAPPGTSSWQLNAVGFLKPHRLNPGAIGILRWEPENPAFELVDAPSLRTYTRHAHRDL